MLVGVPSLLGREDLREREGLRNIRVEPNLLRPKLRMRLSLGVHHLVNYYTLVLNLIDQSIRKLAELQITVWRIPYLVVWRFAQRRIAFHQFQEEPFAQAGTAFFIIRLSACGLVDGHSLQLQIEGHPLKPSRIIRMDSSAE